MELFISDLDGTLLNSDQKINTLSIEIINSLIDQGMALSVATARSLGSMQHIVEPLRLKLPYILQNGAVIYDPVQMKNLLENFINSDAAGRILDVLKKNRIDPFVFTQANGEEGKVFYGGINNPCEADFIQSKLERSDNRFVQVSDFSLCLEKQIVTICVMGKQEAMAVLLEELKQIKALSIHYYGSPYVPGYYWIEMANEKATKQNALLFLKKYLNAEKLICFGDNLNDHSMFEISDEAYAVENAVEAIKKCATGVIGSNNKDGVAKFLLERYKK